jgi:hypothetical protein
MTTLNLFRKGNWSSFALSFALLFIVHCNSYAQEVYARVLFTKVEPQNVEQYLKTVKENVKPLLQLAKKNGEIADWFLYQIHHSGTSNDYNFASVILYDSWAKTEKLPDLNALTKQVNPKAPQTSLYTTLNGLRKIVRDELYQRVDVVDGNVMPKYFLLSFMKPSPGMWAEYVKLEKEIWNPIHKELTNAGTRTGWSLWELVFPGGAAHPYNFVTTNGFTDYSKMNEGNYEAAFKKAHPDKKVEDVLDRTGKSRQIVRNELWQIIENTVDVKVAQN